MTLQLETGIPLPQAAKKYGVSTEALTRLVRDGIIRLSRTQEGDSVITVSTADNDTVARMILDNINPEQYNNLRGRPIRATEAAERYGINQANLSRWADAGYIRVLDRRQRFLLLDEATVKLAADIFKSAQKELKSFVRAGWVLKQVIGHLQSEMA